MEELVSWLNKNQGFVMSILTCVYVVATCVIVFYNRKTIQEMKRAREEESRPYVFANFHKDPRDKCFYLRIKNHGRTGAKVNKVCILPRLKFVYEQTTEEFLKDTILAPGQVLQFIILEEYHETIKNEYDVSIDYSSTYDSHKRYSEKYKLIVQYATQMGYTDQANSKFSDEVNALNNIANYLDAIRNKM